MTRPTPDTEELLRRAGRGDQAAVGRLLDRHRPRLCQMVSLRMAPRLRRRLDPSDVVQEALAEAAAKLPDYLRKRPLPFYVWLRHLTWQRLVDLHRQHVHAHKRSVMREEPMGALPEQSAVQLADRLAARQSSPSHQALRRELRERVREALDRLTAGDRELLILMYVEQLGAGEVSAVLGISEKAVTMRHLRALDRLHRILGD